VAALLTMPPTSALGATLTGLLAASVIQRRDVPKTLFNLGSYATSGALMSLVYYTLGQAARDSAGSRCWLSSSRRSCSA